MCPSSKFGEQRRDELLSATPRRATCSYILSERHHPDGEIGDARVAVAAQPRGNRRFVAHRHGVADVLCVAVLEQPNIVGGVVRVAEHLAGICAGLVHFAVRAEGDGNACDDANSRPARRLRRRCDATFWMRRRFNRLGIPA